MNTFTDSLNCLPKGSECWTILPYFKFKYWYFCDIYFCDTNMFGSIHSTRSVIEATPKQEQLPLPQIIAHYFPNQIIGPQLAFNESKMNCTNELGVTDSE